MLKKLICILLIIIISASFSVTALGAGTGDGFWGEIGSCTDPNIVCAQMWVPWGSRSDPRPARLSGNSYGSSGISFGMKHTE